MQIQSTSIAIIIIIITAILLFLGLFIVGMLFLYQKKQLSYEKTITEIKSTTEKNLLKAELDITEQTFQNISREIHDNISLNLTLVKLKLNTLDVIGNETIRESISSSVQLLSKSISDLSDISKTLNSEIINEQGLIKALELELQKVENIGLHKVDFKISGNPIFMEAKKELIVFRIIQECINNILKPANANRVDLIMAYNVSTLKIILTDNGKGFDLKNDLDSDKKRFSTGLKNIRKRISLVNGSILISSELEKGTTINIAVPI